MKLRCTVWGALIAAACVEFLLIGGATHRRHLVEYHVFLDQTPPFKFVDNMLKNAGYSQLAPRIPFHMLIAAIWGGFIGFLLSYAFYKNSIAKDVCPKCRYNLQGTPDHCPECGWQRPDEKEK